jgi:uncharacterized protein
MNYVDSTGEHIVQERLGTTGRAAAFYKNQMLNYLNPLMEQYIQTQEMMFIATADAKGQCDCSFRAGSRGFVRVLDSKRLVYPEYRGNGVMASLGNIVENPHIGIVFLDFYQSTVGLHINGTARLLRHDELQNLPQLPPDITAAEVKGGHHPECWVLVEVEEAYIHCSKHIPLLQKLDKDIQWGTDDELLKGGDFFRSKSSPRVLVESPQQPDDKT